MTLNWQNLKEKKCPFCSHELDKADEDGLIHCVQCSFSISEAKFRSVLMHRGLGVKPAIRMKWQHLHEGRCPACAEFLKENDGVYAVLACSSPECDFKIREDRLKEILADPNHVANLFYKKMDEDIEKNLSDLNNL